MSFVVIIVKGPTGVFLKYNFVIFIFGKYYLNLPYPNLPKTATINLNLKWELENVNINLRCRPFSGDWIQERGPGPECHWGLHRVSPWAGPQSHQSAVWHCQDTALQPTAPSFASMMTFKWACSLKVVTPVTCHYSSVCVMPVSAITSQMLCPFSLS